MIDYTIGIVGTVTLLWSTSGIIMKRFSSKYGNYLAVLASGIGEVIVLSMIVAFMGRLGISLYSAELSVVAGILDMFGYLLFYKSLEKEQVSNTYATVEIQVVILLLYGVLVLGEKLALNAVFGIALVMFGTLAVSMKSNMKFNLGLVPAIFANVFWAFGWIALIYPIAHTSNIILPNLISFIVLALLAPLFMAMNGKRNQRTVASRH
ncbi:membrane protein containing DUF6, transmembrane, partial [mine drainage metagenome]